MFLTTPGLVKRDLKGKDGLKFQQKLPESKNQLNQSIQSLIESVVMPETFTGEKNLDEMDSSLLDFVKGQESEKTTDPPMKIAGIFKEAELDSLDPKLGGRKRRPAGKSQTQTSRRTHVSGDLLQKQNEYLKQQLALKNKYFSSQEFDLLNDSAQNIGSNFLDYL